MPSDITGGMATGASSQTIATQGSLDRSASCVQPLPGDESQESRHLGTSFSDCQNTRRSLCTVASIAGGRDQAETDIETTLCI